MSALLTKNRVGVQANRERTHALR